MEKRGVNEEEEAKIEREKSLLKSEVLSKNGLEKTAEDISIKCTWNQNSVEISAYIDEVLQGKKIVERGS